jgi:Ca-activated chloride channel family protein
MNERHDEAAERSAEDLSHERLCALALGELEPEEARSLRLELEADPALRAAYERIEATLGLVSESLAGDEALSGEVLASLERAARPLPRFHARPAVQLAAGLAALVTGVLGGRALWPGEGAASVDALPQTETLARLEVDLRAPVSAEPVLRDAEVPAEAKAGRDRFFEAAPPAGGGGGGYRGPGDSAPPARGAAPAATERLRALGYVGYASGPTESASGSGTASTGGVAPAGKRPSGPGTPGPGSPGPSGAPTGPASAGPSSPGPAAPKKSLGLALEPNDSRSKGAPEPSLTGKEGVYRFEVVEEEAEELEDSVDGFLNDDEPMSEAEFEALCRDRAELLLHDCRRLPDERPQDMFFRFWGDNPFVLTRLDAQSTFSVDVDTASYALARRYLMEGHLPEKAQVRTEEFVNYFRPDLEPPREGTFAIHTELAPSRFGQDEGAPGQRWMLRVGLRGREVAREERAPVALTFVVDTSGSMRRENRMELVKHALRLLVAQLDAQDSIALVAFENSARLVLPMTSAQSRGIIEAAIHGLQPGGGTNAEGGLMLGYEVAAQGLTQGASNRVVLLSDGVANIGETDQDRINEAVRRRREAGIFLNTIGVGLGNHDDDFLEQLADRGDGLCNYVDSEVEARRALVDNFVGAFEPIARDVKLQVEFDPEQVTAYRLLGYENRDIADADFRNDAVDAGEVGAGHQVVALYELELTGRRVAAPMAEVRVRWKAPTGPGRDPLEDAAVEASRPVRFESATTFEAASRGYRRSVLVAQFAEFLRRSVHAREDSLDELIAEARALRAPIGSPEADADFDEFVGLLERSRELVLSSRPVEDDLARCVDAVRRNRILRAQLEELRREENQSVIAELEEQNAELEGRIRELLRVQLEAEFR